LLLYTNTTAMLGDDLRVFQSCQHIPSLDFRLILDHELPVFGQAVLIADKLTALDNDFTDVGIFLRLVDMQCTTDLRDYRFTFRLFAGFEDFLYAWKTGRDICAGRGHTTGVESTQGQLCTWLANGLGGDNADRRAKFH